jgi:subfamily B ATP-binding cassette protein MsbA
VAAQARGDEPVPTLSEHEANRSRLAGRPVYWRLLSYVRPYVPLIALAMLLAFGLSSGRYVRAYLAKPLFDDVVLPHASLVESSKPKDWIKGLGIFGEAEEASPGHDLSAQEREEIESGIRSNFLGIIAVALVVVFVTPLIQYGNAYMVAYTMGRIRVDIQRDLCAKLLALPLAFHNQRKRGDVLARITSDANAAHGSLTLLFSDFVEAFAMMVVGSALLFFLSWQLACIALLLTPAVFAVISLFGRRIRRTARRRQETIADVTQRLIEILAGIKVIKAFRAEPVEDAAYRRETRRLFRHSMKAVKNRVLATSLIEMLNHAFAIGLMVLGTWLVLRSRWNLSVGGLVAFGAVMTSSYKPVKNVAKGWVSLVDAQPAAERFFEVMDTPVEIRDAPGALAIDGVRQGVRLRDVSFSYGREPVLRGIDLEARAGEVVALVGRTGAGKTTLIDLIMRLYDPQAGSIEIDGVDLRRISRDSLMAQLAVVGQEPFLFDGSIWENIRYGRPGARDEEVAAAARAAHVDEFVDQLPEGYATLVGTLGARLSAGQRQRVTIARAILKNPAILIFDEATSALDAKSERYVQDAIDALLGGPRTVFMIAHRLSTIRRADKIAVLEGGRITQIGTHAELLRVGGLYRELVALQTTPGEAAAAPAARAV